MTLFLKLYPQLAEDETRTLITINHPDLPPDRYAFAESFCDLRGCDCRRVLFSVFAMDTTRDIVATMSHAMDDSVERHGLARTFLEPMGKQTDLSPALLAELVGTILQNPAYQARLLRHYQLFKDVVDDLNHPLRSRIYMADARTVVRTSVKVGRNEVCPCGSGVKYKRCYMPGR